MYKSKFCRKKLQEGNGFVHMYMSERELFSNRRGPYHGLSEESEQWIRDLKGNGLEPPKDGLFDPRAFEALLQRVEYKNEFSVRMTLHDLVCPTVTKLAVQHVHEEALAETYDLLKDRWDELWIKLPSVLPVFGGPKPDYSVGFSLSAFTEEQQNKLDIIASEKKVLKPTDRMHFPFLTGEAKSWQQSVYLAENQNGHNMFIAVLAMVELFRTAGMDVSGQILGFSVAYNHRMVCMHAYYPILNGEETNICRHSLGTFLLSPSDSPDPWSSWRLVRNVYEMWAPDLYKRLCKAIDSVKLDEGAAAPDPQATPAPPGLVVPMDTQLTDGRGGGRAAPRESGQQSSRKKARTR